MFKLDIVVKLQIFLFILIISGSFIYSVQTDYSDKKWLTRLFASIIFWNQK